MLKLKQRLVELLTQAINKAQQEGKLPSVTLPEVLVEHPQNPEHGDYASSISLKLARATGINPLTIANDIAGFIAPTTEFARANAVPPGFINFTLKSEWLTSQVNSILGTGYSFGNIERGQDSLVQIEFVSVNPTGPLHVGHGRGAVLGSTLANILTSAGYTVQKEHYTNDAGSQIETFNRSLYTRYQQCLGIDAEMPADGYFGDYMVDLAREIIAEDDERLHNLPDAELIPKLGQLGLQKNVEPDQS